MPIAHKSKLAAALAVSLSMALGACNTMPQNRQLNSVKQPVVERTNYTLDLTSGPDGLSISEQHRLADWFETMDLRYGDRVSIDDPLGGRATFDSVNSIAGRDGIIVSDGAPVTTGQVAPGQIRVVITRSTASVPGCPDWTSTSDLNYNNGTYSNYGCATNANLAAMVANPEDLIKGQQGTGETVVMSSTKAIDSYRGQVPTGQGGLAENATSGGN